ncbi:MAG TPA: hypothetical protein VHV51_05530 [Polyangiaceae bacterium]|jgi:hypothetical protein|nr:hypothetical protein [Polyangiaceae bacterium]
MASSKLDLLHWFEPVALIEANARAKKVSAEARARVKPLALAARSRFRVARELRDAETQYVALSLLREAAFFALCAFESLEAEPEARATSPREAWSRFVARADEPPGAPEQLELVREAFANDDPWSLELVPRERVNDLRLAAEATVAWLLDLVELRTPSEIVRARIVRSLFAALGFALIALGLIAYCQALVAIEPR